MARGGGRLQTAWMKRLWAILRWVTTGLLLVGCTANATSPTQMVSPLATATTGANHLSILPTATLSPMSPTPLPSAVAPSPSRLVVLHTNDNWGETDPCG